MRILLITVVTLFLTGCASQCKSHCLFGFIGPGNTAFDAIGHMKNTDDPCQYIGKEPGYTLPGFCFSNRGKSVKYIYDKNNKLVYTLR